MIMHHPRIILLLSLAIYFLTVDGFFSTPEVKNERRYCMIKSTYKKWYGKTLKRVSFFNRRKDMTIVEEELKNEKERHPSQAQHLQENTTISLIVDSKNDNNTSAGATEVASFKSLVREIQDLQRNSSYRIQELGKEKNQEENSYFHSLVAIKRPFYKKWYRKSMKGLNFLNRIKQSAALVEEEQGEAKNELQHRIPKQQENTTIRLVDDGANITRLVIVDTLNKIVANTTSTPFESLTHEDEKANDSILQREEVKGQQLQQEQKQHQQENSSSILSFVDTTKLANKVVKVTTSTLQKGSQGEKMIAQRLLKVTKVLFSTLRKTMRDFLFHPQFGNRGENFIIFEILLLYSFSKGKLPMIDEKIITFMVGPMVMVVGLSLITLSMKEFYNSYYTTNSTNVSSCSRSMGMMSSYIYPMIAENNQTENYDLITTGVYSYIRHPFYAGVLWAFIGLSVISKSVIRIITTALYYMLIRYKSYKEENELLKFHKNQYANYQNLVRGRFFPAINSWQKNKKPLSIDEPNINYTIGEYE